MRGATSVGREVHELAELGFSATALFRDLKPQSRESLKNNGINVAVNANYYPANREQPNETKSTDPGHGWDDPRTDTGNGGTGGETLQAYGL